jgi:hypothetical protein
MMKLQFLGPPHLREYHGRGLHILSGQTVEVDEATGEALMADFPGVFLKVEGKPQPPAAKEPAASTQSMAAPPRDKQIAKTKRR